jgi:hypothetical protein
MKIDKKLQKLRRKLDTDADIFNFSKKLVQETFSLQNEVVRMEPDDDRILHLNILNKINGGNSVFSTARMVLRMYGEGNDEDVYGFLSAMINMSKDNGTRKRNMSVLRPVIEKEFYNVQKIIVERHLEKIVDMARKFNKDETLKLLNKIESDLEEVFGSEMKMDDLVTTRAQITHDGLGPIFTMAKYLVKKYGKGKETSLDNVKKFLAACMAYVIIDDYGSLINVPIGVEFRSKVVVI